MSKIVDEVLTANLRYSHSFGDKAKLGLPPARRFAILTCMDACAPADVTISCCLRRARIQ